MREIYVPPRFFPDADFDVLVEGSSTTASRWMADAISDIDDRFGKDFAKKNPSLVVAFMQTAAIDCHGSTLGKAAAGLSEALDSIAAAIGGLGPADLDDISNNVYRVSSALDDIAVAINNSSDGLDAIGTAVAGISVS